MNEAEPIPPAGEIVAPVLSEAARAIWNELAPMASAMGTLTKADEKAFGVMCELQATLEKAFRAKDNPTPDFPFEKVMRVELQYAPVIRHYYEKFGLEPVGRARISVPKKREPENEWAAMGVA